MTAPRGLYGRLEALEAVACPPCIVVDQRETWRGPFTLESEAAWHAEHVAPIVGRTECVIVLRRLLDDDGELIRMARA